MNGAIPAAVEARINAALTAIAAEFKAGAKLTLLVRNDVPTGLDANFVMTNDTLEAAIAGLERRRVLEA